MIESRWQDELCCVVCHGALSLGSASLNCMSCDAEYEILPGGIPIIMTARDRENFSALLDRNISRMSEEYSRRQGQTTLNRLFRALSPPEPVYINPNTPGFPQADSGLNLWLGGGGVDTGRFINIDLSNFYGVDLIAHAGRLPFQTGSCDRIACLALLEHVPNPNEVVQEAYRVLRPNGLIEAVVPFCHPYHPYPADYSRFSREGLAALFSKFSEVEIGIRTGPTTTMLAFMNYYGKLIFPVHCENIIRRWLNRSIMGAFGWISYPLVYLDHWLNRLPESHVLANHLYVTGIKSDDG